MDNETAGAQLQEALKSLPGATAAEKLIWLLEQFQEAHNVTVQVYAPVPAYLLPPGAVSMELAGGLRVEGNQA